MYKLPNASKLFPLMTWKLSNDVWGGGEDGKRRMIEKYFEFDLWHELMVLSSVSWCFSFTLQYV